MKMNLQLHIIQLLNKTTILFLGYKIEQNIENIENFEFANLIAKSINRKSGQRKEQTGEGTIVYQNIEIAEKQASFIETDSFSFKLVIMCRVRPDKIRAPEDYKELWILNPNSEEVRPYRILVKFFQKLKKAFLLKIFINFITFQKYSLNVWQKKMNYLYIIMLFQIIP